VRLGIFLSKPTGLVCHHPGRDVYHQHGFAVLYRITPKVGILSA